MGFEGYAVAIMAILLLAYVVPNVQRRRAVVAEAPLAERYAEDLRMLTTHTEMTQLDEDHGTLLSRPIRVQERKMNTARTPREDLRSIARNRSRAVARIANRRAAQTRGLVIGGGLAALMVLVWILAAATSLSAILGVVATVIAGGYFLGFAGVVRSMNRSDDADRAIIETATRELVARKAGSRHAPVRDVRARAAQKAEAAKAAARAQAVADAKAQVEALNRAARDELAKAPARESVTRSGVAAGSAVAAGSRAVGQSMQTVAQNAREDAARVDAALREKAAEPAYTLKPASSGSGVRSAAKPAIQKRTVKPYVAPEQATAAVPYRPTTVGEKLGAASAVSGVVEQDRTDVLGGGAMLDGLLERRRA